MVAMAMNGAGVISYGMRGDYALCVSEWSHTQRILKNKSQLRMHANNIQ